MATNTPMKMFDEIDPQLAAENDAYEYESDIFHVAIEKLGNCWVEAMILFFVLFGSISICFFMADILLNLLSAAPLWVRIMVVAVIVILALTMLPPLYFGIKWFYFQAAEGRVARLSEALSCYVNTDRWKKSVKLYNAISRQKMVMIIPEVFAGVIGWRIVNDPIFEELRTLLYAVFAVVVMLMVIVFLFYSTEFMAIPYIFAIEPDMPIKEIINMSKDIMKGTYLTVFSVRMRCLPIYISYILGLTIPIFLPIYMMMNAVMVRKMYNRYTEMEDARI